VKKAMFAVALALAGGAAIASQGAWGLDHRIDNAHAFIDQVDGDGAHYALEPVFHDARRRRGVQDPWGTVRTCDDSSSPLPVI
jgi:hypothetical protein